jgi:hypothetical protein
VNRVQQDLKVAAGSSFNPNYFLLKSLVTGFFFLFFFILFFLYFNTLLWLWVINIIGQHLSKAGTTTTYQIITTKQRQ